MTLACHPSDIAGDIPHAEAEFQYNYGAFGDLIHAGHGMQSVLDSRLALPQFRR